MVYETGNRTIDDALERVFDGETLDRTDGLALLAQPVDELAAAGAAVRDHFGDGTVDACSIVNAKAGNCAEDCGFCAQSVHFDTGIDTYDFLGPEKILEAAKRAERDGAQRFGIVVAERGVSRERRPEEWAEVIESIRRVREACDLEIDASLGILTEEEAAILAEEGIGHYNHNIETSPRYFPEVVGTHEFEDRVATLEVAKEAGMDLCAGVILGMGETPTDRVDAAIALQEIGVSSLPVNVLNPVAGTALGDGGENGTGEGEGESVDGDEETETDTDTDNAGADITTEEIVETVAVYRLLHPHARVRLTGGREVNLAPEEQHLPFEAGADGILTGDYLTTEGQSPGEDIAIVERAGLEPNREVNEFDPAAVKARSTDDTASLGTAAGTATSTADGAREQTQDSSRESSDD